VVLQCNGYEVFDLGVMTPAQKNLDFAREKKANIIGLSPHHAVARRDVPLAAEMELRASTFR